jgi:hypothetical protein
VPNVQKYVASTTLGEPLPWSNSTLLKGDAPEAVARLKERPGKDLVILGSGELVQSLMHLIDEYMLTIHPLVLGSGRRLFTDGGAFAALRLVDTKTTTTGVVLATYQPAERTAGKTTWVRHVFRLGRGRAGRGRPAVGRFGSGPRRFYVVKSSLGISSRRR